MRAARSGEQAAQSPSSVASCGRTTESRLLRRARVHASAGIRRSEATTPMRKAPRREIADRPTKARDQYRALSPGHGGAAKIHASEDHPSKKETGRRLCPRKAPTAKSVGRSSDFRARLPRLLVARRSIPASQQWRIRTGSRSLSVTAAGPSRFCTGVPCLSSRFNQLDHQRTARRILLAEHNRSSGVGRGPATSLAGR